MKTEERGGRKLENGAALPGIQSRDSGKEKA